MSTNEIKTLLVDVLPAVDFNSEFLFAELDSLGVATILYVLSKKYGVALDAHDVTPKNFKNVEAITKLVRSKMMLESKIKQFATTKPDKIAVISGEKRLTYSQLWEAIVNKAEALKSEGLKPHHAHVFRTNQSSDFIITYCAVHYLKAVAVPIEHSATEDTYKSIRDDLDSYVFPDDVADTLYTTGSTGKAKGVMLSHTSLTSCSENFIVDFKFNDRLCFIVSGPLNHIASLFKINPTLCSGATVCILDGLKDMNAFFNAFDLPYEEFATFLVPASIRIIMSYAYDKLCSLSSKIAFIETGASPITKEDMEQLSKALPHSRLYNGYGATEFGCATAYDFNDGKYIEGCIGRPLKNAKIEIGPDGTLVVSGLGIMSGYVKDEENTKKVLIDGKIHMSDLGYVDEDGLFHITGRIGEVINVGGFKVNPNEVESVASSFPSVKDCICVAATHPVIGPALKLIVVSEKDVPFDKHALAVYIKSKLEAYKVPTMFETADSIRYTYNGKKDRKSYKDEG